MTSFRLHSHRCPHGRPDGVRRLDLGVRYGAFPVWTRVIVPAVGERPAQEIQASAGAAYLKISAGLGVALQAWADWADLHQNAAWRGPHASPYPSSEDDWARWVAEGRELAARLARETGDAVVYRWPAEGRDAECPHCGDRPRGATGL